MSRIWAGAIVISVVFGSLNGQFESTGAASLAGAALSIPGLAAAGKEALNVYVESSVATLAFVLAVTNILCPFMVRWILRRHPADEVREQKRALRAAH